MADLQSKRDWMRRKGGTALGAVLVFTSAITLVVSSSLKNSITQTQTNERHISLSKAKYSSESISEFALAQVISRWQALDAIPVDDLGPGNNPITIPTHIKDFYTGTGIDSSAFEVIGTTISDPYEFYVDPSDPSNAQDPDIGKTVTAYNVTILTKAKAAIKNSTVSTQSSSTLQIRETPILSNAAFFNSDLEIHPSQNDMSLSGTLRTNQNLYLTSATRLNFEGHVLGAGEYHHNFHPGISDTLPSGAVYFKDSSGNPLTDYSGSGSTSDPASYYDSNYDGWTQFASSRWGGSIQTKDHNISPVTPLGFEPYVRDNPDTDTVDDALNHQYALIEPNLPASSPNYKGAATEKQKFAQKAGLIVKVHDLKSGESISGYPVKLSERYAVTLSKIQRTDTSNPNSPPVYDADGNIQEVDLYVTDDAVLSVFEMQEYVDGGGEPTSGLWDARRGKGVSNLQMNIDKFRSLVDDTVGADTSQWTKNYNLKNDYNGIVYVELPTQDTGGAVRPDKVVTSQDNMGLKIVDAQSVPNPSYNNSSDRPAGFTLATNSAMYLQGSFNADGDQSTGSATAPDSSGSPNAPALLVADSITALSQDWKDAYSKYPYEKVPAQSFMEINASVITGFVPTDKAGNGSHSGGLLNSIRLLEDWSSQNFRFRGSVAALYESEVANEPYTTSVYKAPAAREWGYYSELASGKYPPGSIKVRSFHRIGIQSLSPARYAEVVQALSYNDDPIEVETTDPVITEYPMDSDEYALQNM